MHSSSRARRRSVLVSLTILSSVVLVGKPAHAQADQRDRAVVMVAGEARGVDMAALRASVIQAVKDANWLPIPPQLDTPDAICLAGTGRAACAAAIAKRENAQHAVVVVVANESEGMPLPWVLSSWVFDDSAEVTAILEQHCSGNCSSIAVPGAGYELTTQLVEAAKKVPIRAYLVIESEPAGATVRIGEQIGTTPGKFKVAPGMPHRVRVELDGYHTRSHELTVERGTHTVRFRLVRKRAKSRRPWIVVGVGAAAVVGGGIALALDQDMRERNGHRLPTYYDTIVPGSISLGLGAIAVGVGSWLLYRRSNEDTALPVTVSATENGASVGVVGAF